MLPEKLSKARILAVSRAPYFATLAFSLIYVETNEITTMAVDPHGRLYFSPQFVEKNSIPRLATVLEHEWLHIVRRHHERGRGKNTEKWNLAADAEINDDLQAAKRPLNWNDYILPSTFSLPTGHTAEQYYDAITRHGLSSSGAQDLLTEGLDGAPPGLSPNEIDFLVEEVKKKAVKLAGSLHGRLLRGLLPDENAKIDWRAELRFFFSSLVEFDFDIRRGFRRPLNGGIVLPRIAPRFGAKAAIIIDTSASMTDEDLSRVATETLAIAKRAAGEVVLIAGDTQISYEARTRRGEDIRPHFAKIRGGGGTDLRPLIARAETYRPDVIVVATDCYTPWPQHPTKAELIVLITPNGTDENIPRWVRKTIKMGK